MDDDEDLIGKLAVIDDAHSPHHGEVVRITAVEGDTLTIVAHEPAGFTFGQAFLPRNQVRVL